MPLYAGEDVGVRAAIGQRALDGLVGVRHGPRPAGLFERRRTAADERAASSPSRAGRGPASRRRSSASAGASRRWATCARDPRAGRLAAGRGDPAPSSWPAGQSLWARSRRRCSSRPRGSTISSRRSGRPLPAGARALRPLCGFDPGLSGCARAASMTETIGALERVDGGRDEAGSDLHPRPAGREVGLARAAGGARARGEGADRFEAEAPAFHERCGEALPADRARRAATAASSSTPAATPTGGGGRLEGLQERLPQLSASPKTRTAMSRERRTSWSPTASPGAPHPREQRRFLRPCGRRARLRRRDLRPAGCTMPGSSAGPQGIGKATLAYRVARRLLGLEGRSRPSTVAEPRGAAGRPLLPARSRPCRIPNLARPAPACRRPKEGAFEPRSRSMRCGGRSRCSARRPLMAATGSASSTAPRT